VKLQETVITSAAGRDQTFLPRTQPSSKLRPASFLLSASVHGTLLALVSLGPRPGTAVKRPVYESLIRPNEKKIVWYRKLPEISPPVKIGDAHEPRGEVKSDTVKIVVSPKPSSSRQLILHASPQIKLSQDLPSPDLVALVPAPAPPPAPKQAKPFVAPPATPKPPAAEPLLAEPELTVTWTDPGGAQRSLTTLRTKLPPKPFTPPPGREGGVAGGRGTGPGPGLESGPSLATTGSNLNAAIIGLHPTDQIQGPVPPGERSAQFGAAPRVGAISTGDVKGGDGLAAPGLMVRNREPEKDVKNPAVPPTIPPPIAPRAKTVLYDDLVPSSIRPTLSAPLRPASRTIPRALEARFQGRLVYAMVIPAPNLPAYTGDWIIWFAELERTSGDAPSMRAPIPLRKAEPIVDARALSGDRSEARIQLASVIKANGQFDDIVLVKGPNSSVSQSAIADLNRWEFRPATRGGGAVGVEVVIEIPFSVAWLNGSQ
jgi:hypothetical protein